ncbi:hypothetical protein BFN03_18445 [Rhodococcus sp. WMMA185]|nr:hypothetical protein BFN03_18445 [Rhodococcus sp. WMMA185]
MLLGVTATALMVVGIAGAGAGAAAADTVIDTIGVGASPRGIAITPDGTRAYVTNEVDDNVSVIDTATNAIVDAPIPVGNGPIGVAITPNGARAYVTSPSDSTVLVIDTGTNTVIGAPIPVGGARKGWRSPRTAPAPTSPTLATTPCR